MERKIGVVFFKPDHIIGWWRDTDSFMNMYMCILESITDIYNPGSEYMHIRDSNVYSEGVSMCHRTIVLTKIKTLNMKTPICTVACNTFLCIITVA